MVKFVRRLLKSKLVCYDHPWDPEILAVVDMWLFRGHSRVQNRNGTPKRLLLLGGGGQLRLDYILFYVGYYFHHKK